MGQSDIVTKFRADAPIAISPEFDRGDADRRYIEDQILGTQQMLADGLLNSVMCSWFRLSVGSPPLVPGQVFCSDKDGFMVSATYENLKVGGTWVGLAMEAVSPGATFRGALRGLVPAELTGLGPGPVAQVYFDQFTGMPQRMPPWNPYVLPDPVDLVIGTCNTQGGLLLRSDGLNGAGLGPIAVQEISNPADANVTMAAYWTDRFTMLGSAQPMTVTVPTDAQEPSFVIGQYFRLMARAGANGNVGIIPFDSTVTINSPDFFAGTDSFPSSVYKTLRKEYSQAVLTKTGTNEWALTGDIGKPAAVNFGAYFPGAFAVMQSDVFQYGSDMAPNVGNTATTLVTLQGSRIPFPVPILVKATNSLAIGSGATFNIYYDGVGTTPAMTITPPVNAPVPLTGAATGISLVWSAGTSVNGNIWRATCATLLSVAGLGASQGVSARQPFIDIGLNGKPCLSFDATLTQFLTSTLATPVPNVTPYTIYMVFTPLARGSQQNYLGSAPGSATLYDPAGAGTGIAQYSGLVGNSLTGVLSPNPTRVVADFTGTTADRIKVGAFNFFSGTSAGLNAGTIQAIGAGTDSAQFPASMKLFLLAICPKLTDAQVLAVDAAVNSINGYGPGNVIL